MDDFFSQFPSMESQEGLTFSRSESDIRQVQQLETKGSKRIYKAVLQGMKPPEFLLKEELEHLAKIDTTRNNPHLNKYRTDLKYKVVPIYEIRYVVRTPLTYRMDADPLAPTYKIEIFEGTKEEIEAKFGPNSFPTRGYVPVVGRRIVVDDET